MIDELGSISARTFGRFPCGLRLPVLRSLRRFHALNGARGRNQRQSLAVVPSIISSIAKLLNSKTVPE